MILFLDTVSSLPEFSLIEDNKIIFTKKILTNNQDKMSDFILPVYINLEKKFFLTQKLKFLVINTGPGSYTSLRIGISFLSGLSLGLNISLIGLTCFDLFRYAIANEDLISSAIFINSSYNQNFICIYCAKKNTYTIHKIEDNNSLALKKLSIKKIFTNNEFAVKQLDLPQKIKYRKLNFNQLVNLNMKKIISLPKQDIIEPIYISNNKILN